MPVFGEEISLLYRLTQNLKLSSNDEELAALALEWLSEVVPAESLAIQLTPSSKAGSPNRDARTEPLMLAFGPCPVDCDELTRMIAHFALRAGQQPMIVNQLTTQAANWPFPAVREMIAVPLCEGENCFGWLVAFNHTQGGEFGTVEASMLSSVGTILGIHSGNAELYHQQREFFAGVVRALTSAIDAKDPYTCGHSDRVARLATPELPRGAGQVRGLFVYFADFGRMFVAREAWSGGQRRMADDDAAPSRSYLKIEEAYIVLGREPQPGETVVDLGAAPGGWSYSAAKRGARVIAVDNGPLKGGAFNHPLIEHRLEDAFKFTPATGEVFDWLFCDLVEEPHHVMQNIVTPWLAGGWCRRFVINLKFGHVDSLALLGEVRANESPLFRYAANVRIRHLYHDREEFTLAGEIRP